MSFARGVISPRLALALVVFCVGLVGLAAALAVGLLLARRRNRAASDDYVVRLLQNSAVPLALQLAVRAIDLGFGIALYRIFADAQSALTNYVFAAFVTTVLLATIAEWGLNIFLTREVARDPAAAASSFGTSLALRLGFAVLVLPASLLVVGGYNAAYAARLIPDGIDREGLLLMVVLGATVLPSAISGAVTALFLASERPIVPAVVGLLINIISALLKVGALVLGLGILGVAGAALIATCISAGVFAALYRRSWGRPQLRFDRRLARRMLSAGWPLMLNSLLLAVFFRFDLTIIRAFRVAELPAYDAAYKYVNLTQILPPIVINAVFPLFARHAASDRAALTRAYSYLTRLLLLLALPLAAGATVLAPWLIAVYGQEYVGLGAPALQLLIWYLPLSYINGVTQYVLIALERPKAITFAFGLAAIFNLVFNLVFVPLYGIRAAAAATVLSEIVLFVPLWRVLRRQLAPESLLAAGWKPLCAALGMALAMLALTRVHVLLGVVAAPPLFWALLVALRGIRDDDRQLLRRILRRQA